MNRNYFIEAQRSQSPVPVLMKISHVFLYLSDSKNQKIIDKALPANDRGNWAKEILIRSFRISDPD